MGQFEDWIKKKLGADSWGWIIDMNRSGKEQDAAFRDSYIANGPGVKDQTNQNIGTNMVTPLEQAIQLRNEEWQREDAIRAETQAREDSTMQRWVADARKAGINPNLALGASGSPSGGGITSQTGSIDYTMTEAEFNKTYEMLMQEIELNFKGDQAEKDRIANLIKALITGGALLGGAAIKGAK